MPCHLIKLPDRNGVVHIGVLVWSGNPLASGA